MNARTAAARPRARVTRAPRPERQSGGRECVRCLNPLPDGATMRRLFCSDACRAYAARDRSVTKGPPDTPVASVTEAAPPTYSAEDRNTASRASVPPSLQGPLAALSRATADNLMQGRLSQRCPDCGTTEAAGYSCSRCGRRTSFHDWVLGRDAGVPA